MAVLPFDGSLWCNIDIALRKIDQVYTQALEELDLAVIEAYMLWALYNRDGQHASELAKAVGRAPTSFTPILDKLQRKEFIERRSDPSDRRAIRVYLTPKGEKARKQVLEALEQANSTLVNMTNADDLAKAASVLLALQTISHA